MYLAQRGDSPAKLVVVVVVGDLSSEWVLQQIHHLTLDWSGSMMAGRATHQLIRMAAN